MVLNPITSSIYISLFSNSILAYKLMVLCLSYPQVVNVKPRPRESTVHDIVGVYKSTKCHIEIILEIKVGNERLWNPEFVVFKPRVQLSFRKKK